MTQYRRSVRVWGVFSILAGALMGEGGIREVVVYWPSGELPPVVVGLVGAVASVLLIVSGVAFCTRQPFGRQTAIAGAVGMAPVHLIGWLLGIVGIPGALLGVVYPTLLLLVLRNKPDLGAPIPTVVDSPGTSPTPRSDHTKRRSALSAA